MDLNSTQQEDLDGETDNIDEVGNDIDIDDDDDEDDDELSGMDYEADEGYMYDNYISAFRNPRRENVQAKNKKINNNNRTNNSRIKNSDFEMNVTLDSGINIFDNSSLPRNIFQREITQQFSITQRRNITNRFLPNTRLNRIKFQHKPFCGTYSRDGNVFLSACQDKWIRIYNTSEDKLKKIKSIQASDVGWSILDTAFSPDGTSLVYSSWSDSLYLLKLNDDGNGFIPLNLNPNNMGSFGIFSVVFSHDGMELLGGSNDDCIYVYNNEIEQRTLKIRAHVADVNAVMFADESSHILFSGSDDGLCKVWDRRTMDDSRPEPVGILSGHIDGIVYIDSKQDGRYLISNSKDQTIKLWDIRRFSSSEDIINCRKEMSKYSWDYRWQIVPYKLSNASHSWDHTSVMTLSGHSVQATLIRCRFSPVFSTGQRYIYSGCAKGFIIIFDALTGSIVSRIEVGKERCCVRDVSWHPFENNIIATSWDCSISKWIYVAKYENESDLESEIFEPIVNKPQGIIDRFRGWAHLW